MARKKQLRLTRRPGKFAFWIYEKNLETRMGKRVYFNGEPLVIQAYTERQAISFYVRTFLHRRGKFAVQTFDEYFCRLVKNGARGSQTEMPYKTPD